MTTVHAYTRPWPCRTPTRKGTPDLRRTRAAALIVPTSTGAAKGNRAGPAWN